MRFERWSVVMNLMTTQAACLELLGVNTVVLFRVAAQASLSDFGF